MDFCSDCSEQGRDVAATRRLPSKRYVCDEHWRQRLGIPKLAEKTRDSPSVADPAQPAVPRKAEGMAIDAHTAEQIKKDAAAGVPIARIVEKHNVSFPTAKKYAGSAAPSRTSRKKISSSAPKSILDYSQILESARTDRKRLEADMDRLDDLIKALEQFEGK